MSYLKIHCGNCKQSWEIYHRDNWKADQERECPHCGSRIEKKTWDRQILPAFGMVDDANRELFKDHTGYHVPLFTFDVIADPVLEESEGKTSEFSNFGN